MIPSHLVPVFAATEEYEAASAEDSFLTSDVVPVLPVDSIPALYGELNATPSYTQAVYIRRLWDDPWVLAPWIHAHDVTYDVAPSLPQAQLTWDYGAISRETKLTHPLTSLYFPRDIDRWYVRVVMETDSYSYLDAESEEVVTETAREWVGVVCFTEQKPSGDLEDGNRLVAAGEQLFTAFGMEKLLAEWYVKQSVWEKVPANEEEEEAGEQAYSDFLIPFNPSRRGRMTGNRSAEQLDGSYVFAKDPASDHKWSNRDIVEYLLRWHNPEGSDDSPIVLFRLEEDAAIVELEPPELDPTGQTVHTLLCRLIDRRRLITWFCEYDLASNHVLIRTRTATPVNITLPIKGSPQIPKNRHQRKYFVNDDAATSWADRWPAIEICDQVIARGARRVSVCTTSFGEATLEKGWSAAQETKYREGASNETGYAELGTSEKQRRNADARSRAEVSMVHSLFRLPLTWNFTAGDGIAGGEYKPVFPSDDDPDEALPVCYREMFCQQYLPLKEGVSYKTINDPETPIDEANATGRLLGPQVFMRVPKKDPDDDTPDRWVLLHKLGSLASLETRHKKENHKFSGHVEVPDFYQGIAIKIAGEPQHVIAKYFHNKLDADQDLGGWDYYEGMMVTLALPDDRYCQGIYPETPPEGRDALRIKLINAGERYRKDYVVPETAVDVDTAGEIVRSTGGFLPIESDEDDEHQLAALAKIAWVWYGQRHHVVQLDSMRVKPRGAVGLGHLVTTIGSKPLDDGSTTANTLAVNSIITQVHITWPKGIPKDGNAPRPMMSFTTWAGELEPDPVQPAPLVGGPTPYMGPAAPAVLTSAQQRQVALEGLRRLGREAGRMNFMGGGK